ncbi:MAG TPA: trypsin-like peptidase domain-containing protein [Phycisphaerae bacterium]|nr:trypsin-like peptidase domain-containing protein [Phycisphaerae bacterium]
MSRDAKVLVRSILAMSLALIATARSNGQIIFPPVTPNPLIQVQDCFEHLIARIAPSVVSIEAQSAPDGPGRAPATVLGSGFVIRAEGMILTSDHVVGRAAIIHVILSDGSRRRARKISSDPRSDLAVIQIDAAHLRPLTFTGSRGVRRGHIVLAFGNPLGLAGDGQAAASFGLVSAIARPLPDWLGQDEDRYYGETVQTTAQIGPGYSGGPLVDIHGRVIGVLTAATQLGPSADSLAFAVPMTPRHQQIIEKLLSGQSVDYGYLGVQVRDRAPAHLGDDSTVGAVLQQIYSGGPADRAGLIVGDEILEVDDRRTASADQLVQMIGSAGPSAEVHIRYRRDGQFRDCLAMLARRLPDGKSAPPTPREYSLFGAALAPVDNRAGVSVPQGAIMVVRIESGSPADRAGLMPGDIIVRVDGQTLTPEAAAALSARTADCLVGLANGGSVLIRRAPGIAQGTWP